MEINIKDEEITRMAASIWGKKGGKVRSEKKARAVRKNGKLGGRPRKSKKASK
jgi:hypothetical protein